MKKKTIIAAIFAASILAGCSSTAKKPEKTEADEEETITIETPEDTTEASEETTEATTEETTEAKPTESKPAPTPGGGYTDTTGDILENSEYYEIYRSYAEQLNSEGDYKFGFEVRYLKDKGAEWILQTCDAEGNLLKYHVSNGEVTSLSEQCYFTEEELLSYEDFLNVPFITETNDVGSITSEVENGWYYGSSLAVSTDGTKLFFTYGEPVILTAEEYNCLEVGDYITTMYGSDVEVSKIEEKDGKKVVDLNTDAFFVQGEYVQNTDDYVLFQDSCPVSVRIGTAVLDIAPDCEVTDSYDILYDDQEGYAAYLEENSDDNPIHNSYFWYYMKICDLYDISGEWLVDGSLLYPVEVKDNKVVSLNLEWR